MISDQTLQLNRHYNLDYGVPDGGFFFCYNSKTKNPTNIKGCREEFAYGGFTKKSKYIGFFATNINLKKLELFWRRREEQLNIPADEQTVFYKTTNDKAVILKLNDFWLKDSTARGFTSLFLRMGAVYYNKNLKDAIQKYRLAQSIELTINHFLAGNTKPTFKSLKEENPASRHYAEYGIVAKFRRTSQEKLNYLLVRPDAEVLAN